MITKIEQPKKGDIRFTDKVHPKDGIFSTGIAVLSMLLFVSSVAVSAVNRGRGSIFLGIVGIFAFILACIGFAIGIRSFQKDEIYYLTPILGIVINGILIVSFLFLYIAGTL